MNAFTHGAGAVHQDMHRRINSGPLDLPQKDARIVNCCPMQSMRIEPASTGIAPTYKVRRL
jgi:hypothetical protein